jgi:frataxin-like iron-binding protein CyaY
MRDKKYIEHVPAAIAESELESIEWELEALNAARDMDVDMAEAIVRIEIGSKVNQLSSKELRRDLMILAKRNPKLFLTLANDENVQLRNFGINAVEQGILRLAQDQRSIHWGSNDRKLMTVPFDENPYSALASWFKTDEGVEVYKSIEKRLV